MHILDKIIQYKIKEVEVRKEKASLRMLQKKSSFNQSVKSITEHIQAKETAIIAEFKHKSPSKQNINLAADPTIVSKGYENAGAVGISVLTDAHFFGGSFEDLQTVKKNVSIPVLQKDFIIDPYQIFEAKANGADFILLIAAVLTSKQIADFASLANNLGLEVLVEIHNEEELQKATTEHVNLIGVNNRNLKTFDVNLEHSMQLAEKIPLDFIKISESGISDIETIFTLKSVGFKAFLMGENFMKTPFPAETCKSFINRINSHVAI